jgi:hypothetical protein
MCPIFVSCAVFPVDAANYVLCLDYHLIVFSQDKRQKVNVKRRCPPIRQNDTQTQSYGTLKSHKIYFGTCYFKNRYPHQPAMSNEWRSDSRYTSQRFRNEQQPNLLQDV